MALIAEHDLTHEAQSQTAERRHPLDEPPNEPPVDQTGPKRKPSQTLKILLASVASAVLLLAGLLWWFHASSVEETDDSFIEGHVHELSARINGTVVKVAVDDNEHVQRGQLLVQIDPKDFEISVASSKAAWEKAKSQAEEAKSTTVVNSRQAQAQSLQASSANTSARAQISKARESLSDSKLGVLLAKAQIEERQAELTRATSDYQRYSTLVKERAVTTQSYEKARQDKEVAQANLDSANATYNQMLVKVKETEQSLKDTQTSAVRALATQQDADAATAQTEVSRKTIAVQEAAAKQAQAEYENALTQLSYTRVVAPVSGTVGHKTVEVGQQIERGQALMSVVSDEKWVVANFKETQLGKMHVGQSVDIKIDALPGRRFTGKVQSIAPASGAQFSMLPPDNASGNFTKVVQRIPVKIVFDPECIRGIEQLLTPGMSVVPEVHLTK